MEIAGFIERTRHIRPRFLQESSYLFSEDADDIISRFCEAFSIQRRDVAFYPAYTSRASPELIRFKSIWYIIWDYHFVELVDDFNLITLVASLLDGGEQLVAANITQNSLSNHFLASLFKYLSCQFFRRPYLSLALADSHAQLACPLRVPIRRDYAESLLRLRAFQWSYVLHHELAHVYFPIAPEEDRARAFDSLKKMIHMIKDYHDVIQDHVKSSPSSIANHWWSQDFNTYEKMLESFSEQMVGDFDKTIAEEIVCDMIALKSTAQHWCVVNTTPFRFENADCVSSIERSGSAANLINNFRLLLEYLRIFWHRMARLDEEGNLTSSVVEDERDKTATMIQEVFLRGAIGWEVAYFGTIANAFGQQEVSLDDPRLLTHLEKSTTERKQGLGIEGFDERLTRAWSSLKDISFSCMAKEVVELIFEQGRDKASKLTPQKALREAQLIIDW